MDHNLFWKIVASGVAGPATHPETDWPMRIEALRTALERLTDADLVALTQRLRAAVEGAASWDLWAAGWLIFGGMSDDAFRDFRMWLVTRGREVYERVLADPDSLAELKWGTDDGLGYAEEWGYVPDEVLEARGLEVEADSPAREPAGVPFDDDDDADAQARLPRTWARVSLQ